MRGKEIPDGVPRRDRIGGPLGHIRRGQRFRLLQDYGNPMWGDFGDQPVHLESGMVGTVREVVPAGEPGAGSLDEDSVVLVFLDDRPQRMRNVINPDLAPAEEMSYVRDEANPPPPGWHDVKEPHERAVSFDASQVDEYLEEVAG